LDRQQRTQRLQRVQTRVAEWQAPQRRGFATAAQAQLAGERLVQEEQVQAWLQVVVTEEVAEEYRQSGRGRPGPATEYRRLEHRRYRVHVEEDGEALRGAGLCDGLFPLLTNDEELGLAEALHKYKYQPFVEKRHEQLKNVCAVTPMWLKNVGRVASLLWLYYVVELVAALVERELRQRMEEGGGGSLALYPEGRASGAPTAGLVFSVLEGHRRHRLLDEQGRELRQFHDPLTEAAQDALALLGVDRAAYGLE
jgi:transposase